MQVYVNLTDNSGTYNNQWRHHKSKGTTVLNPFVIFGWGLVKNWDLHITIPFDVRFYEGQRALRTSDVSASVGWQVSKDKRDHFRPDVRLTIGESFPSGQYRKLVQKKKGTDASGSGAFTTDFGIKLQKLFYTFGTQFLSSRLNISYALPSDVRVIGLNTYGGSLDTRGTVKPGHTFTVVASLEQTLSRHWALATDVQFSRTGKTRFSGTSSDPSSMASGDVVQWSLAPAIEYNINENCGFIGGAWFTVSGKNSPEFTTWVLSFTYAK